MRLVWPDLNYLVWYNRNLHSTWDAWPCAYNLHTSIFPYQRLALGDGLLVISPWDNLSSPCRNLYRNMISNLLWHALFNTRISSYEWKANFNLLLNTDSTGKPASFIKLLSTFPWHSMLALEPQKELRAIERGRRVGTSVDHVVPPCLAHLRKDQPVSSMQPSQDFW